MLPTRPRQLREADRSVEPVSLAAGCFGQGLALGEPPFHFAIGNARVDRALRHEEERVGRVHLVANAAEQCDAVSSPLERFAERAGRAREPLHGQGSLPWMVVAEQSKRLEQRGTDKL